MKIKFAMALFVALTVFCSMSGFGQTGAGQAASAPHETHKSKKNKGPGKEIASGGGDVGKGAAKGAADLGKGAAGGAGNLATGNLAGAGTSAGKGTVGFGKSVAVGSGKGTAKIGKGLGGEFKKVARKSKKKSAKDHR